MRQILCDLYQIPLLVNVVNVLDAHSKFFFRNINPGLDREHHSFVERNRIIARVVDIKANVMAESMNEVFAKRAAVQILAV